MTPSLFDTPGADVHVARLDAGPFEPAPQFGPALRSLPRRPVVGEVAEQLDALVFPTVPCPASVAHDREDARYVCEIDDHYRPCYLANTTGNPEITVPAGFVPILHASRPTIPDSSSWPAVLSQRELRLLPQYRVMRRPCAARNGRAGSPPLVASR